MKWDYELPMYKMLGVDFEIGDKMSHLTDMIFESFQNGDRTFIGNAGVILKFLMDNVQPKNENEIHIVFYTYGFVVGQMMHDPNMSVEIQE